MTTPLPFNPDNCYQAIVLDPPWPEDGGGQIKRGADGHYDTRKVSDMPTIILRAIWDDFHPDYDDVDSLDPPWVWRPDPRGCHVWMWVTGNYMKDGLNLMESLGVRYINHRVWNKADLIDAVPVLPEGSRKKPSAEKLWRDQAFGIGHYVRGAHETVLFGMIGKRPRREQLRSNFGAPRTPVHSEKPACFYDDVRKLAGADARCLDMFGREGKDGWDVWGDKHQSRLPRVKP
jgi:N6-adenosine-specific RNA methylase IME4